MSIESVMPSNHYIPSRILLLQVPSIFSLIVSAESFLGFLSLHLKMRLEIILTALQLYDRGLEELGGTRKETK